MARVRIGISGWTYPPWRGTFYPAELPHKRELQYASGKFNSIEINGSFYSLQKPSSYRAWRDQTPDDFVFSVKGGRYITHMKKLKAVESALANFFASGLLALEDKLGPILWQLPPMLRYEADRLDGFLEQLPRDTLAAAKLARRHDQRLAGRAFVEVKAKRPIRHAIEVRHPSFEDPKFIDLLRAHGVAMVVADTAGKWPVIEDVTADFIYVRLHGDEELYVSGYTDRALASWAAKIGAWLGGSQPPGARAFAAPPPRRASGRDVYVYFDNDTKVRAPFDAMALAKRLGIGPAEAVTAPDLSGVTEEARQSWPAAAHGRQRQASTRRRTGRAK